MTATTMSATTYGRTANSKDDALERFFSTWENAFCAPRSVQALANEEVKEPDVLDYVFEHVESFTCAEDAPSSRENPYRQERHPHYLVPDDQYKDSFDLSLRRENSLVEKGPNGAPALVAVPPKRQSSLIARLGEEGDLLDYCFEHVESYVCAGDDIDPQPRGGSKASSYPSSSRGGSHNHNRRSYTASHHHPETSHPVPAEISTSGRHKKKKKHRNRLKKQQNYYPDEEDNILLYYKPIKRHQ